jgi:hypothetical protein
MMKVKGFACLIACGLIGVVFVDRVTAQQVTAKYEVSGQIDSDKVPTWIAGAARMTGSVSFASTEERVTVAGDKYVVESTATGAAFLSKFFDNLRVVRRSEGSWVSNAQATTRYYEKRGSTEPATAVIDYRSGTARFNRGPGSPTKVEPIKFMTSDTAALPFVFLGRPRPAGPVTYAYTDGRFLRTLTIDPTVVFEHRVGGTSVPTVRYVSRRVGPKDAEVELWIREEDGFPLRIRLTSARYGLRGEANLIELPPVFKRKT